MIKRKIVGGLLAAGMLAGAVPARAEWLEAKSPHFTVTGDVSEQILRRRVERLERFDATMRQILSRSVESNLPVVLLGSAEEVRTVGHLPDGVLAYFYPSPYGVFAVTPVQTNGIGAESVMFHEYVHHMMMGSLDEPMPRWMNEGMAELFMNTRLETDGGVTIGLGDSARGYSLNRVDRWTVERMLDSDRRPPSRFEVDQLYAKGWLLLHYLLFSGKRPGQFTAYAEQLRKGVKGIEAGKAAFGDLGKLETELELYRGRSELPAIRIPADKIGEKTAVTIRTLSPAEAEMFPMRVSSMAGVSREEAGPLAAKARPVAGRWADSAYVQRAMAEMEFDARSYDAADRAIDLALKDDPQFVDAMAFKAVLVGARALREGKPELWPEARRWIIKANRAAPNNPFPLLLYFDSYAAAGQPVPAAAIDGALKAVELQPSYQWVRAKAAVALLEAGDTKLARTVLAPAAQAPHQPADNPMAKLLAAIDDGADKTRLAACKAGLKLDRANLFAQVEPEKADKGKPGDAAKPADQAAAKPKSAC